MKINGKNFKVYLCDTVDTIKARIAVSMQTLSEYLVFEPELESPTQTGDLTVTNVLTPILKATNRKFPEDQLDFSKIDRAEAERIFVVTHTIGDDAVMQTDESNAETLMTFVIKGLTALGVGATGRKGTTSRRK